MIEALVLGATENQEHTSEPIGHEF
jgi:hypothetical protein